MHSNTTTNLTLTLTLSELKDTPDEPKHKSSVLPVPCSDGGGGRGGGRGGSNGSGGKLIALVNSNSVQIHTNYNVWRAIFRGKA